LNTIWQIDSCDSLSAANWQLVQVFTNLTGQQVFTTPTRMAGYLRPNPDGGYIGCGLFEGPLSRGRHVPEIFLAQGFLYGTFQGSLSYGFKAAASG
jgi:hypothetical protein